MEKVRILEIAKAPFLFDEGKQLLVEYGDYMFDKLQLRAGKQNFFKQLETFPGVEYQPPFGTFVIAISGNTVLGCGAMKAFDTDSCEMKRVYVRPEFRGIGVGKALCDFLINWCPTSIYKRILLDTNLEMYEAVGLYKKCGFREIDPYCIYENDNPVFMEYTL